jgi:hypothetical protein
MKDTPDITEAIGATPNSPSSQNDRCPKDENEITPNLLGVIREISGIFVFQK